MKEGVEKNEVGKFEIFHGGSMVARVNTEEEAWDTYNRAFERTMGAIHDYQGSTLVGFEDCPIEPSVIGQGEWLAGEVAWHGDKLKQKWRQQQHYTNGFYDWIEEWRDVPKFDELESISQNDG